MSLLSGTYYITGNRFTPCPLSKEPQSCKFGMHEHHVSIALTASVERLAGALRDHFDRNAGFRSKDRK